MALAILGQQLEIKIGSAQTGGAYGATEAVIEPGWSGPQPHIHHREDEAVYVVEGALHFTIDGDELAAPAGTLVHIPRGAVHSWRSVAAGPSRSLTVYTPGGFEQIFTAVGAGAALADVAGDYELELVA